MPFIEVQYSCMCNDWVRHAVVYLHELSMHFDLYFQIYCSYSTVSFRSPATTRQTWNSDIRASSYTWKLFANPVTLCFGVSISQWHLKPKAARQIIAMESLTWSWIWEPMNDNWVAFELKGKPVQTTTTQETMALNNCESKHNEMWEQSETTTPARSRQCYMLPTIMNERSGVKFPHTGYKTATYHNRINLSTLSTITRSVTKGLIGLQLCYSTVTRLFCFQRIIFGRIT